MLREIPKEIMYVYLCGIMLGKEHKKPTVDWRYRIRQHYSQWKKQGCYEISFLDPFNGEIDVKMDIDGLTAEGISSNTIFTGDKMAIKKSNIIVANFNQFESKRISVGTFFECGMALAYEKPLILIVPKKDMDKWKSHPFTSQSAAIFDSVDKFLDSKILNWFYKRINHANYSWDL
jgi:nucleoside 2-deoxyribosyltransferase